MKKTILMMAMLFITLLSLGCACKKCRAGAPGNGAPRTLGNNNGTHDNRNNDIALDRGDNLNQTLDDFNNEDGNFPTEDSNDPLNLEPGNKSGKGENSVIPSPFRDRSTRPFTGMPDFLKGDSTPAPKRTASGALRSMASLTPATPTPPAPTPSTDPK